MVFADAIGKRVFRAVHSRSLVYNTCWEDPRLDREALQFRPDDHVAMITSAGCNALDYVLAGAGRVHAVDINPRQNHLLELKMAAIRSLDYDTFFSMFGRGHLADPKETWQKLLRPHLSPAAQVWWDRNIAYFENSGWRQSFYFHGASGFFARLVNTHIDRVRGLRELLVAAFSCASLDEQRALYAELQGKLWKAPCEVPAEWGVCVRTVRKPTVLELPASRTRRRSGRLEDHDHPA